MMMRRVSHSLVQSARSTTLRGVPRAPVRPVSASTSARLWASMESNVSKDGGIDRIFATIDNNADGVIQPGELGEWLNANGLDLSPSQLYELYSKHDSNADGVLQKNEFADLLSHVQKTQALKQKIQALQATALGLVDTHCQYEKN
jgi:hypothetical protein